MMNTWDTWEVCNRKMIPYVRLISAMILQQNSLPPESLWVSKPVEEIYFASMKRHWKIQLQVYGHQYMVSDDQGHSFQFVNPCAAQEVARVEEMRDEEDEDEPPGPRGPRQRYHRTHREVSASVANFVTFRRTPGHADYNRGQQAVYDNVSAAIGENREYEERRKNWEQDWQARTQSHWAEEDAHGAKELEYWEQQQAFLAEQWSQWEQQEMHRVQESSRRQAWEHEQDRLRLKQNVRDDNRWRALATAQELAVNNAKHLHDQERHQRDYMQASRSESTRLGRVMRIFLLLVAL
ncbi:hypothetical protein HanRHA438_Chr11g0495891 [Helianthus annuus]|nr:hypothetical protein HanHA300_Chr11g0395801 [Helianthus annuus]KAJ0684904.1 hypothetical protein HanLR1_Chr11g0396471 [Helianthus annuus]KAJ0688830.1 hypothetical protein HanOQP8_Chr11g0398681 [Helianthus annuus]KAJ0870048.1 hypothetical protein HanRHA438_Chr11g0495891 [Helianthus annuus]